MTQRKHPTLPQAKGATAGSFMLGTLLAKSSLARAVYSVPATDQVVHALNSDTGLLRVTAKSYGLYVAFAENPSGTAGQAYSTLTVAANPTDGDTMTLGDQEYVFHEYLNGKAHSTFTLTGAITPGSHAESVLTTNGTNPAYGENVVVGGKTYRFTDALVRAARGTLTVADTPHDNQTLLLGAKTYRWRTDALGAGVKASKVLTFSDVPLNTETVSIEGKTYTYVTALTEVKASSTLTLSANVSDGNSVTIGSTVYTFKETLGAAYQVKIGASASDTIDNLIAAINGAAGEGSTYGTGTVAHPDVTAAIGAGDTMGVTAKVPGVAGNSIATTELSSVCSWTSTVLQSGVDPIANEVVLGTVEQSVDRGIAAMMGSAGEGTTYSTGTTHLASVTVTKVDTDKINAEANSVGYAGNSIVIGETLTNAAWAGGATALSGGIDAQAANDVYVGASAETAIDNLVLAITAGAGIGTNYGTGTTANADVTAVKASASTMTATAITPGAAGNAIASTTSATHCSFGATTLANGHDMTANDVLIDSTAAITLDNFKSAVNATSGAGTKYGTGTTANAVVIATDNADTTQKVIARVPGTAANSGATTTTSSTYSWPDTTLGGGTGASNPGVAAETVTIDSVTYSFLDVLSETNGAAAIANQVLFGADSAAALDNLKLAINKGATEGTNYSTGTVVHPTVTATTNANDSQVVEAKTAGVAGNSIATTKSCTNGAWRSTVLIGGHADTTNSILIGAAASNTQGYIQNAINGSGTAGTEYSATLAENDLVYCKDFGTNVALITAKASGEDGDGITTTAVFTSGSNTLTPAATAGGTSGLFDDYIPAGTMHEYGIDDSISVMGLTGDGGTASAIIVEHS